MGWKDELLTSLDGLQDPGHIVDKLVSSVRGLGFEHAAFGLQIPWQLSQPRIYARTSYPAMWEERYMGLRYHDIDPTVAHARRSLAPLVWSDEVFADTPQLWDEARECGLKVGCSQSCMSPGGIKSIVSIARSAEPLTEREWRIRESDLRWLANVAHLSLGQALLSQPGGPPVPRLSDREADVLKWTADGKTSGEIATILSLSTDTVNYHVRNAVAKLGVANKTAATVRAAMLGLLV